MSLQVKNDEIKSDLQQNLNENTVIIKERLNLHLKRKIKNLDSNSTLDSTASTKENVPTLASSSLLLSTTSNIKEITNKNSNKMENRNSFIKKMKIAETVENSSLCVTSTTTSTESGILKSDSIADENLNSIISTSPTNESTTDDPLSSSSSSYTSSSSLSSTSPSPSSPKEPSIANYLTILLNKKKLELMNDPSVIDYFENISNVPKGK